MAITKYKKSIIIAICIFFLLIVFVNLIDKFFDKYDLSFQLPVVIKTQSPVLVNPRVEFVSPVSDAWAFEGEEEWAGSPSLRQPEGEIEQEIYDVFGDDWIDALTIFKCESGLRPDAVNKSNKNGTVDAGIPQINTVHGISVKWLKNYKIALLVAKQIFDEQGFSPWYSSFACHGIK